MVSLYCSVRAVPQELVELQEVANRFQSKDPYRGRKEAIYRKILSAQGHVSMPATVCYSAGIFAGRQNEKKNLMQMGKQRRIGMW